MLNLEIIMKNQRVMIDALLIIIKERDNSTCTNHREGLNKAISSFKMGIECIQDIIREEVKNLDVEQSRVIKDEYYKSYHLQ